VVEITFSNSRVNRCCFHPLSIFWWFKRSAS